MRFAIIGLVTIAAALTADVQAASAINYDSFFQERYCSRKPSGRWNCAYKTLYHFHTGLNRNRASAFAPKRGSP